LCRTFSRPRLAKSGLGTRDRCLTRTSEVRVRHLAVFLLRPLRAKSMSAGGTCWPLVGGALVSHGSLVRVRSASDAISLSSLCSPSSRAEREFLSQVTAVQGWVLDYNQQSSAWHIILFCFLRDVIIPSEHMHMVVISCIPMSLAFGDLLLANRCGTLRSLVDDIELHLEREVLHVVAVHSKLVSNFKKKAASVGLSACFRHVIIVIFFVRCLWMLGFNLSSYQTRPCYLPFCLPDSATS